MCEGLQAGRGFRGGGRDLVVDEAAPDPQVTAHPGHDGQPLDLSERVDEDRGGAGFALDDDACGVVGVHEPPEPLGQPLGPPLAGARGHDLHLKPATGLGATGRHVGRATVPRDVHGVGDRGVIGDDAPRVGARLPRALRERANGHDVDPLAHALGAEDGLRVGGLSSLQGRLLDRVPERRIRLSPPVTVRGGPPRRGRVLDQAQGVTAGSGQVRVVSVDAVGVTERQVRLLPKAHQHDGRVITGVGQAPGLRLGARHHGLGDRAPRVPVRVLAQLVEDNQVGGQATPGLTVAGLDLVPFPGLKVEGFLAVDLVDVLDGGGQFGHGLCDVDAAAPQLLGDVEVLGGAQRHLHAEHVHGP